MVARPDGGGGGDTSGVGYKLDVKVESLQTLATELEDDAKNFGSEFDSWDQKGKLTHPENAQFAPNRVRGSQPGSLALPFEASVDLAEANAQSYGEAVVAARMIEAGVGALFQGAKHLAKAYKNLDDANAVSLSAVNAMFPEPKKPAVGADAGPKYPPHDQWKPLKEGWDTNNDGKVDIPFGPSGKPPETATSTSVNSKPADDDPTKRDGYKPATNIDVRDDDDMPEGKADFGNGTGLDGDAFDDMRSREPDKIIAPGPIPGDTSTGGSGAPTLA